MEVIRYRQPIRDAGGNFMEWHYWGAVGNEGQSWTEPAHPHNGRDTRKESQLYIGRTDSKHQQICEGDIVEITVWRKLHGINRKRRDNSIAGSRIYSNREQKHF